VKRVAVGDVCDLVNGKAFKPEDWATSGVPIIRIQNLNDNTKPFNYWSGNLAGQVEVRTGDVLLAWSGTPGTSFGVHIWDREPGILNQHIFRVDLQAQQVTPQWFRYAVNGQLNELIAQAHGGVGLQHVTRGMVDRLCIPLPPLDEQLRIVAMLDKADELRQTRKRAITLIDSLTRSIFMQMFGHLQLNEHRWPVDLLARVVTNEDHRRRPVAARERRPGPFPYYGASGIIDYVDRPLISGRRLLVAEDGANLLSRSTDIAFIAEGEYWVNNHAHVLADNGACNLDFLRVFLLQMDLKPYVTGTAQPKLNRSKLDSIPTWLPPRSLQDRFSDHVASIGSMLSLVARASDRAHALFSNLQHRAFSAL
jgi:type I restriction enzyme, S subunit